jgi:hypothetical protein
MTIFTFTSEDLEKINAGKTAKEKIFPRVGNVRIAEGLMKEDGVTPNWDQATIQLVTDAQRGIATVLKNENESKTILHSDSIKAPTNESHPLENSKKENPLVTKIGEELETQGLSEQQINDFKFMTNQGNIGSIAAELLQYFNQKDIFQNAEKRSKYIQNVGGVLVQLEISKVPPDNEAHLTYKTATRITLDKKKQECNYSSYGMCASYEIASKDNMIIMAEVDLGPLGSTDYTPKTTCSILAEGKIAEQILGQIKDDIKIPKNQEIKIPKNQEIKRAKEIKAEYEEIVVKTLQATGYEEQFQKNVKSDIELILSQGYINQNLYSNKGKRGALKEFNSTPQLFVEVLVESISEINKIEDHKQRAQAMQKLTDNAQAFFDQPKGYMKILVNDTAKEMAKAQNINLPKEGLISKISNNIKLMIAKMNVKIHGKSSQLKKQKLLIHAVRNKHQSNTGPTR